MSVGMVGGYGGGIVAGGDDGGFWILDSGLARKLEGNGIGQERHLGE